MNLSCDIRGAFLGSEALSRLMPMHMLVDPDGVILSVGPTIARMRPDLPMVGERLLDRFHVRRPHGADTIPALAAHDGRRLQLEFREAPHTALKGHFALDGSGRFVFDLSFGILVSEAVATYGLTAGDFAPTSLAIEMLYLVEAKSSAMLESHSLNLRLSEARAVAERLARTDALTGLLNRRGMASLISELVERDIPFAVMHVDLDYFKTINDTYGHAAGDHVLVRVARLLEYETREIDSVIRLGGDEFVVIFRDLITRSRLSVIAERIIAALDAPIPFEDKLCRVSASIGITTSDLYAAADPEKMLHDADQALYRSKLAGRSRVSFFDGPGPGAAQRTALQGAG